MSLNKFKKKSNVSYKPSNYLDGVQERRDFRNKMKAELKSMAQETFIEQFEMLKVQDTVNKRSIVNNYQELENEIKKLKSTVEELQNLKTALATSVTSPLTSSPPFAVLPITPSGPPSNNLWSIDTFPFFQPNANSNNTNNNEGNKGILDVGVVANSNPNSNMFILSTAPLKLKEENNDNRQENNNYNGVNMETNIALSIEDQAHRLRELQALFTIPTNVNDESPQGKGRRIENNNVTVATLQRRDQSINDYIHRMDYSKNLKQKPSVLSPRSKSYKNNRTNNSMNIEGSPNQHKTINYYNNNDYYLTTNDGENNAVLASSLENSEHNIDTVLSAEEFYQITERMRDEIRELVLVTVKEELDASGKAKYYTKREISNSISKNKDAISNRVEKRVGDRIAALQQELEYLRVEKIDIPVIQKSYQESSVDQSLNPFDEGKRKPNYSRNKKPQFPNNDDLSDISDISNFKKIKKNDKNKKEVSKTKSKKVDSKNSKTVEKELLDESDIIVKDEKEEHHESKEIMGVDNKAEIEKVNMATQVSVPSSPLVVPIAESKSAISPTVDKKSQTESKIENVVIKEVLIEPKEVLIVREEVVVENPVEAGKLYNEVHNVSNSPTHYQDDNYANRSVPYNEAKIHNQNNDPYQDQLYQDPNNRNLSRDQYHDANFNNNNKIVPYLDRNQLQQKVQYNDDYTHGNRNVDYNNLPPNYNQNYRIDADFNNNNKSVAIPNRNISVSFNDQSYQDSAKNNYHDNRTTNDTYNYPKYRPQQNTLYEDVNNYSNRNIPHHNQNIIIQDNNNLFEDVDNNSINLNAPTSRQRSQKSNRPRSRVRSRGNSSDSERGKDKNKSSRNNSPGYLKIDNANSPLISSFKISKEEEELQKEHKSIMITISQMTELKAIVRKEIKDWTKEFEDKNKRQPTNADKAAIDDKFVTYQVVTKELSSTKELLATIEERMLKK